MERDKETARMTMLVQVKETFILPTKAFIEDVLHSLKTLSNDYAHAVNVHEVELGRFLARRKDQAGLAEAESSLVELRKESQRKAVKYVHKMNELHSMKRNDPLHHLAALLLSQDGFYHQAYEMSKDVMRPILQTMSGFLHSSPRKQEKVDQILDVISNATSPLSPRQARHPEDVPKKQGWLLKKTDQKIRTVWTRTYFTLADTSLSFQDPATTDIDLRVCMVRVAKDVDRRFCFEIISPTVKTLLLQAESQQDAEEWVSHINAAVGRSLHIERSRDVSPGKREIKNETLKQVLAVPGNESCADCRTTKNVDWASYDLGITICLSCSGIHRSLSKSKVRSLTLDTWEPELLMLLKDRLGNDRVNNECFESGLTVEAKLQLRPNDALAMREFIHSKYARKLFIRPLDSTEDANLCLWKSIESGNLPTATRFLALGADVNWICHEDAVLRTALHVAIDSKDVAGVEWLLLHRALLEVRDALGETSLHHAVRADNPRIMLMLLKRNPKVNVISAKNEKGQTAIDVAKSDKRHNVGVIVGALQLYKFELSQSNGLLVSQNLAHMMEELLLQESIPPSTSEGQDQIEQDDSTRAWQSGQ